jgi:membrane fusion protein, multidrug efflux system
LIRPRTLLVAVLALLAVGVSAWWVYDRLNHIYVTDARIAATMITISSRVPGWLQELPIETGDRLRRGDLLLVIDDREAVLALRDAELGVAAARADLQRITAQRHLLATMLEAGVDHARAELRAAESRAAAARAELARSRAEWQRASSLLQREMIAREMFDAQENTYQQAEQHVLAADAEHEAARAAVVRAEAARHELAVIDAQLSHAELAIQNAEVRREQFDVALSHHRILSPVDGVIDTVFVEQGEYVERARQLLILHDPASMWVSANVRETHIRHLEPGAKASIRVDAFPGRELTGVIRRIGQAATSQFALLPTPNPSGNFTKITQRIEVRIDLDPHDLALKPGMMVEVRIGI